MAPGLATWARAVNMQAGTSAGTFAGAICLLFRSSTPALTVSCQRIRGLEESSAPVGYPRHLRGRQGCSR